MSLIRLLKEVVSFSFFDNENTFKNKISKIKNEGMVCYHGSNSDKVFDRLKNDLFYSVEDYIAMSYAYNYNGLLYKVTAKINPLVLIPLNNEESQKQASLLKSLYGHIDLSTVEENRIWPTGTKISNYINYDLNPLKKYAKDNGYDSLMFIDEGFEARIEGWCFFIFNGSDVTINEVYNIKDFFESNFSEDVPPKRIK